MTNDEIKTDIIEACEQFQADGYRVIYGSFTAEYDEPCGGCALAAVASVHGDIEPIKGSGDEIAEFVCARYGWSQQELCQFYDGFDDINRIGGALNELGRAVRNEVHPVEAGTL